MRTFKVLFLLIFIALRANASGQPAPKEQEVIQKFLQYLSGPKWHIDTVINKYVVFYDEESKVASKATRKMYLSVAVAGLAEQLKHVEVKDLKIIPYNDANTKLQIMRLGPDYRQRSYVVTDPTGKFVRYFLIKDNEIEAFELYQKRAYLLLN